MVQVATLPINVWSIFFLGSHTVLGLGPKLSQCPSKLAGLVPHAAGLVRFTTGELLRSFAKFDRGPRQQAGKDTRSPSVIQGEQDMGTRQKPAEWRVFHEPGDSMRFTDLASQIWMKYLRNNLKRSGFMILQGASGILPFVVGT